VSNLIRQSSTDGFEGFEAASEGADPRQAGGVIQGTIVKFDNNSEWVTRSGEQLPPDLELIAVGLARIVQKWLDGMPAETRVLGPGEKFPDLDELNNAAPRSEWTDGLNGAPRGPWQRAHHVFLLDPTTMDKFTYTTSTVGGAIAVRELVDKTTWMRRYRGQSVYPVVALADVFMNTRFGGRQRPHFIVKRWVDLGGGGATALPASPPPTPLVGRGAATVEPVTLGEETDDEIPF
jgi:hypothetical protein